MAEDIQCSLPDTQTQTQGSQIEWSQHTPIICDVWGRLFPTRSDPSKTLGLSRNSTSDHFQGINTYIDLTEKQFKVGRALHCNFIVKKNITKDDFWNNVSKEHFVITRDTSDPSSPAILHDLSFNGTFVNAQKIGKGKRRILSSKDEISLSHAKAKLFIFMDMIERDQGTPMANEILNKYFISKELGKGACGTVKLVYNKLTCEKFAMKVITKKKLSHGQKHSLNDPEKIMNEVKILKALQHPSIISTEEVFDTDDMVCIVLELMEGGELFDRVAKVGRLDERTAKIIFRQMVLAVQYLHQQGIAHRDLKPENVLLATSDPEPLVKLTDFGLSKLVGEESFMKTMCGTPLYVAPEVILAEGKSTYGPQVDVWSLGVILFICLSGYLPFTQDYKDMTLREQIIKGRYMFSKKQWEGVSLEARKLVLRMLNVNPKRRISLEDILQDEWMKDMEVIQRVNELMEDSATANILTSDGEKESVALKRNLSEASKGCDPPAKRRKVEDVSLATTSRNSSDDTVEDLPLESLSFE